MTERKKASKQVHYSALLFSSDTKPKPNSPTQQKPKTRRRRNFFKKNHATAKTSAARARDRDENLVATIAHSRQHA
jgi:hypothetical protein